MKPIKIKNEEGETIEIKWDADGSISIRHSDIDKKNFGWLREYSKTSRQPKAAAFLKERGIDVSHPLVKELLPKAGASLVIRRKSYHIGADEVALICEAVKKHGGIVPNWSSRV